MQTQTRTKLNPNPQQSMAELESAQPKVCPYNRWYRFHECCIATCKNYTERTEHHCLAVDRVQPTGTKIISDAELHYYKFHSDGISTKYVSIKRKEATERVVAILTLRAFIEYIGTNYKPGPAGGLHGNKILLKRESVYPLRIAKLQFKPWMWPYIADPKVFKKFKQGKSGTILDVALCELLDVTPNKMESLTKLTKEITW